MPSVRYMAAISATGADVNYILTGQRSTAAGEPGYALRPDQKALLDNYENCVKEDRDAIKRMALRAAEATDKEIPQPETPLNKQNQGQ